MVAVQHVGGLQGDGAARDKFLQLFDTRIDRWVDDPESAFERIIFHTIEPYTGEEVNLPESIL